MSKLLHILISFLFLGSVVESRQCFDFLLLDGSERLHSFGMDSTDHWWAVTIPYEGRFRMIIDGEEFEAVNQLRKPVFSNNSYQWAFFAEDNLGWMIFTNDSLYELNASNVGDLVFDPDGFYMSYSYFKGDQEIIVHDSSSFTVYNKIPGSLFIDRDGKGIAYGIARNGKELVYINGKESTVYDDIKMIGFWHDGSFMYAARIGEFWQIYKDHEPISEYFLGVAETKINRFGTVMAYAALLTSRMYVAIMHHDDFIEPFESERYDMVRNLSLHPWEALLLYEANYSHYFYINLNFTEYDAGQINTLPIFSHNGDDTFFISCRIGCYANINGHRIPLRNNYLVNRTFAISPGVKSFAFTTGTSLVMRFSDNDLLYSGMMVNSVGNVRYNRFKNRYEALGEINNRLYLLTCTDQ